MASLELLTKFPFCLFDFGSLSEALVAAGLEEYLPVFVDHQLDHESLLQLREKDLVELGVTKIGPRLKLLRLISSLECARTPPGADPSPSVVSVVTIRGANGSSGHEESEEEMSLAQLAKTTRNIDAIPSHFGDIMSARETILTLPETFLPLERIVLTANGNLQRIIRFALSFVSIALLAENMFFSLNKVRTTMSQ